MKFGWDMGLDYKQVYNIILRHYKESKKDKHKAYDSILLTQLRNGSRLSEAIMFLREITQDEKSFVRQKEIKALKGSNVRLMVLPEELKKQEVLRLGYIYRGATKVAVSIYCKRTYGFNTHSLRYAFISYLAKQGIAPQLIAQITGHKKLDYILHYTSKIHANQILLNLNNKNK